MSNDNENVDKFRRKDSEQVNEKDNVIDNFNTDKFRRKDIEHLNESDNSVTINITKVEFIAFLVGILLSIFAKNFNELLPSLIKFYLKIPLTRMIVLSVATYFLVSSISKKDIASSKTSDLEKFRYDNLRIAIALFQSVILIFVYESISQSLEETYFSFYFKLAPIIYFIIISIIIWTIHTKTWAKPDILQYIYIGVTAFFIFLPFSVLPPIINYTKANKLSINDMDLQDKTDVEKIGSILKNILEKIITPDS